MAVADKTGDMAPAAEKESIPVKNPVSGDIIGSIPVMSDADVTAVVERARTAQPAWSALSVQERANIVRRWGDLIWQNQAQVIDLIRRETGKTATMALNEIIVLDITLNYYYQHAARILKPQRRQALLPGVHKAKVYYKPRGAVGVISPWNFPFHLPFVDALPALIAGNSVVIKPSEFTPSITDYGVDMLHQAGVPRDVVQVVHGDGRTGSALVENADYIAFTGSAAVGRKIAARAGERLMPYSLELGGKHPLIMLQDADIEFSVACMVRGAFGNAGQFCMAVTRVYIEEGIYDRVIDRTKHWSGEYHTGKEADAHMGSLTGERELLRTEAHIQDALAKGAKILTGGKRRPELGPLFFEPTILVDVDHSMRVMREETFGPLLPIMKVKNADEALRLANDSEYAFTASVFTRDLKRGEAIATKISAGDVTINTPQMVIGTPSLPSGGNGQSGMGRRNGAEGLLRYVTPQSMVINSGLLQPPTLDILDARTRQIVTILRSIRRRIGFI